jgi:hypothetical protein
MHVVGHQSIGVNRATEARSQLTQVMPVEKVVLFGTLCPLLPQVPTPASSARVVRLK